MQTAQTSDSFSYAVLRYLSDTKRGITVPVGIVLCNTDRNALHFRLPKPEERIPEVPFATAHPFLQLAQAKIEDWHTSGELPYANDALAPLSEAWWEHVRKLMAFRMQISPVQTIDCQRPEEDIERLFEAVVHPKFADEITLIEDGFGVRQATASR